MMMISSHQQRGELVDGSIPWPLIAFNSSWWFLMETIFKHQMLSICWNKFEDQSHVSLSALPSYFYFWVFLIPLTFDLNPGPDLSLSWCWRSSFVSSRHLQSEVCFIKIISSHHTMFTFDHVFHLEQIVEKLLKRKTSWVECLKFRTISALFWLELLQNVSFGHKLEKKRNNLPFNSHLRDQNEKLKWKFEHLMFKTNQTCQELLVFIL